MRRSLVVLSLTLLVCAPHVQAQSTFGRIVGSVRDASGAAIPRVTISARELDENSTQTTVSNDQGLYELPNLKPGRYELAATKARFSRFRVVEIILTAREEVRADLRLDLAPVEESVTVSGTAAVINTENGAISDSKSFSVITELPLNYRGVTTSPLAVLMTVPGVQQDMLARSSLGGGLPAQIEYSLDGISTMDVRGSLNNFGPLSDMYSSTEMIREFKVISVNNNAEYGQMGDVSVITRGGTNQLHGSALWYHQNAALDATVYGAPSKQRKVYNTFGASLSGPVNLPRLYRGRNRTFFFIDYETNRQPHSTLLQFSVPTAEMRAGDMNGLPGGAAVDPLSGAPFPGNVIPPTRINSAAGTLLEKYYPLPNYNADGTTNSNLRLLLRTPYDTNGYDIRIDQIISPRQQIYGRWTWKHLTSLSNFGLLPADDFDHGVKNAVVSHNFLFRPNLINEFRFGASLDVSRDKFSILGTDAVASLGLQGLELQNASGKGGFPLFDFSDGTGFTAIGHSRDGPSRSSTWQYTDNLSWIRGRHSMKFGADVRRISYESVFSFGGGDDFGSFAFQQSAFSGNAFVDLLLGLPYLSEYGLLGPNLNQRAVHSHFYGQDEWRVSAGLTVDFGLRWTLHPPMTEASGNIANFDPVNGDVTVPDHTLPAAPNFLAAINACPGTTTAIPCTKIVTASQAGIGQGLRGTDYGNWAPRLGFAWRPFSSNKTVVRSGFGIFTQTILGSTAYALTGIHTSDDRYYFNYQGPGISPRWVLPLVSNGPFLMAQPGTGGIGTATNLDFRDPRTYQWNFTLERAVASETTLRVSYIGSHSVGLNGQVNLNQLHPSTTPYASRSRPYPAFRSILSFENIGFASYEGLQAEAKRRFTKGLFFQASYIFSKNIGNAGSLFGGQGGLVFTPEALPNTVTDRFNTRLDRGNLAGSRPQRFLFTGIYELPWGKERRFRNHWNALANALLGGWDVSTITLLEAGPFQTPLIGRGSDHSNALFTGRTLRPDRVGDGNLSDPSPDQWYDITAFQPTPTGSGRFGNAGVGILRGPGIMTAAAGLFKSFSITVKLRMRLEGTFTNILNHPNFYPPSTFVDSPVSFGKTTSVQSQENSGNRVGQIGARLDW